MKLSKTLTPLKAVLMAFAFASVSFADPVNYWNMVNDGKVSAANEFCLDTAADDTDRVAWEDGNWLITGSRDYPANIGSADRRRLTFDVDVSAYGVRYISGGGSWSGTGKLTIGAGGYNSTRSWDRYHSLSLSEIHLADSQTWTRECAAQVSARITAEDNVIWTLTSATGSGLGRSGFEVASSNDLSNAEIVLKSLERLSLIKATAMLQAKSLTMEANTRIYYHEAVGEPVFGRKYASTLILKGGAVPAMTLPADPYTTRKDTVIYDFDKITVADSTVKFGNGFSYSVKDGGTQLVEVAAGATAQFLTLPTAGRIKVTGAGTVALPNGPFDVDYDEDFTGDIAFSNVSLSFPDVSNFSGTFIFGGSSVVAMPATADWPANFKVRLNDTAKLYLPAESSVDEAKILGTGNYSATGRGITAEPAGTVTVNAEETLTVAGSGFGSDVSIVLNGGTVEFPLNATIASPVTVSAASTISVEAFREAVLSGFVTVNAKLSVATALKDSSVAAMGNLVFAGGGTANGIVSCNYGQMEFRGGEWTIAFESKVQASSQCRRIAFTQGCKATFLAGSSWHGDSYAGLYVGSAASWPVTLEISGGAEVMLGNFQALRLGDQSWRNDTTAIIDNAKLIVSGGEGELDVGGMQAGTLQNNTNDRCPRVKVIVRNGGVLETDRPFSSIPITHKLDDGLNLEGIHVTLDGGTYKLGSGFGICTDSSKMPRQHPLQIFGGASSINVDRAYALDFTCEVEMTIGENGGTFDLSAASCASCTNTVMGNPVVASKTTAFPDGIYPTLGPRWIVNGPLNVKGNGNQEFVINGLDPAAVSKIGADGVKVKIVGDNAASLEEVVLGAAGAGLSVETSTGEARSVAIAALSVSENGVYDAAGFAAGSTTVGNVKFGADAVLAATAGTAGAAVTLPISGTVTLADSMYYAIGRGVKGGAILSADGGIQPTGGEGVTWTQSEGFRKGGISVSGTDVVFEPIGLTIIFR